MTRKIIEPLRGFCITCQEEREVKVEGYSKPQIEVGGFYFSQSKSIQWGKCPEGHNVSVVTEGAGVIG